MKIFDADAHMIEPPKLWSERLDKRFRERAPYMTKDPEGLKGTFFFCENSPPMRLAALWAAGKNFDKTFLEAGLDQCPAGAWDPVARLKDMADDGIAAQVLYTSVGFSLFGIKDPAFQEACFRVYNDWLAEFCSAAPKSFVGLALISLYNVDNAVKELERCHKAGLRGAMIWSMAPEEQPYKSSVYENFWTAAERLSLPLALHEATGQRSESRVRTNTRDAAELIEHTTKVVHEIQLTILEFIFSGILERHPGLKLISTEVEIGWIPALFSRVDKYYHRFQKTFDVPMKMDPSDYFRRQVYATFIDDPFGVRTYRDFGAVGNYLWSTDYPHQASSWPHTQEAQQRIFAGVPEEDVRKMVLENTAKVYGLTPAQ